MELEIVRKINGLAGKHPGADRFMKLTARYGHLAFVLYGLWLWFGGSERDRAARRQAAATAFSACARARSFLSASGRSGRGPGLSRGTGGYGISPVIRRTPPSRAITP